VFGFWTGIGTLFGVHDGHVYRQLGRPVPWDQIAIAQAIEWWSWALMTPLVFLFVQRVPLAGRPWPRTAAWYAAAAAVTVAANAGLIALAWTLLPWHLRDLRTTFFEQLARLYAYDTLLFCMVALAAHALLFQRAARDREAAAARLEGQLATARLEALTRQLEPHFLFNTLNTIAGLVRLDPRRAEAVIARLADLLRFALRRDRAPLVALAEELEFLDGYLEIQAARFEERLAVRLAVADEARRGLVPPLVLQPLVENSICHAVAVSSAPVRLEIAAAVANGRLRLVVRDDGPGMQAASGRFVEGIGLGNTRARLEQLYGRDFTLTVEDAERGGVEAVLEVPWRPAAEPGAGQDARPGASPEGSAPHRARRWIS
jgi:signal transduction histidine kinase